MAVSREEYRDAMARLGAAVNLVTTDGEAGRYGLTASAVCSVTDKPPTLLVCINKDSAANQTIKTNEAFCVNVLALQHSDLGRLFSTRGVSIEDRFASCEYWTTGATGSPVLMTAPASFDCGVTEIAEIGSHSVFFGEVQALQISGQSEGLIYFERAFHALPASS